MQQHILLLTTEWHSEDLHMASVCVFHFILEQNLLQICVLVSNATV